MPQFSVIIPNYNHGVFLKDRIESVLAQTCTDFEIILLDDGSTDNSREILEQYRKHPKVSRWLYNETNSGSPFRQWQKGIEMAKGEWIWMAESDDLASPAFLDEARLHLAKYPGAGLYYCNAAVEEPGKERVTSAHLCNQLLHTNTWDQSYYSEGPADINRALKYHSTILNAGSVVFRKQFIEPVLDRLAKFRYYGDWYAYLQLAFTSGIVYNASVMTTFRRTPQSHSMRMDHAAGIQLKAECFRILLALVKDPGVSHKKELILWFIKKYVGFGIKTDRLSGIIKTIWKYYNINIPLATNVVLRTLSTKISSPMNNTPA